MITLAAVDVAMSVLLAGAAVAMLALAAAVLVRSRRTGSIRIFGRTMHRPGLWAAAVLCLSVSGLLRLGDIEEVIPSGWRESTSLADRGLTLAFFVLFAVYLFSARRAKLRRDRAPEARH